MYVCKHCKEEIDLPSKPFATHVRWCKSNPLRNLTKDGERRKRKGGNNNLDYKAIADKISQKHKDGAYDKHYENLKGKPGRKQSEESKAKISKARIKWLQENPEKHPWKRKDKFISVPCLKLKEKISEEGIEYVEEYQPIKERYFAIDIAFPNIKLGLEVNGNQHYSDPGKEILSPYYQERHDILVAEGWKILEIHYSKCFTEVGLESIINFVKSYLQESTVAVF